MQLSINESKRSSLTKLYWKTAQRTLAAVQQPVIEMTTQVSPESLKGMVRRLLDDKQMKKLISDIWITCGSTFANDTLKRLERMSKKADQGIDYWEDYYRKYTNERSQFITGQIMDTQTSIINNIIDRNIEEGKLGGLGIPEMQKYLRNDMIDSLTEMNKYQAERIARTEVIGASNKGSFDGAKASGLEMKKFWLTSALDGIRPSHQQYETEDNASGGRGMDEEYASGLQFPADPEGEPEEIINCRCTVVYDVDEGLQTGVTEQPEPEPEPRQEVIEPPEVPTITEQVASFVIPETYNGVAIDTLEKVSQYSEQKFGISLNPKVLQGGSNTLTVERAKDVISQLAKLKDEYKSTSTSYMKRVTLETRGNVYAHAQANFEVGVNPKWFNEAGKLEKQFIASDKKTFWHPRCVPDELSASSIIDHEFGHILTTNDIHGKYGVYEELRNLKSAYTKRINGINKSISQALEEMSKRYGEAGRTYYASPEQKQIWRAFRSWNSNKQTGEFISKLKNVATTAEDFSTIKDVTNLAIQFESEFISEYGGTKLKEFAAEGFTSAKNGINPSPWAVKVKNIIDKAYKK